MKLYFFVDKATGYICIYQSGEIEFLTFADFYVRIEQYLFFDESVFSLQEDGLLYHDLDYACIIAERLGIDHDIDVKISDLTILDSSVASIHF